MKKINTSNIEILGVILAAGEGKRIQPLSLEFPKPLLPVGNLPIVEHQIKLMKNLGIWEYFLVIGYKGNAIQHFLGDGSSKGIKIHYIEQKEHLGIAHALSQIERYVTKPIMVFLGDIFVMSKNFERLVTTFIKKKAAAVLSVKRETDPEILKKNFSVAVNPKTKNVTIVIEKPYYPKSNLKGCGIYLFDPVVFDSIRNTPRTAARDEYEITTSIQMLINMGYPVFAEETVEWDMNMTTPRDLLVCNLKWLTEMKKKYLVDPSAKIHPQAKIIHSVIGKNVKIQHPLHVENSVVFRNTNVIQRGNITNQIVSSVFSVAVKDRD